MNEDLKTAQHPFLKLLIEHNQEYVTHVLSSARKKWRGEPTVPIQLEPHRFYTSEVMETVLPILNTLDRIRWARAFLGSFPNAQGYKKKGVSRDRWIEYHYSYYAVSYATIRDLALLLTNEIFRLKLPPRLCTTDAILNNGWVKPTDIPEILNELANQARSHQEARNLHVHRGKVPDIAALLDEDLFRSLSTISFLDLMDAHQLGEDERRFVQEGYRLTVGKLSERMGDEIAQLDAILVKLFSSLEVHYRTKFKELTPIDFDAVIGNVARQLTSKSGDPPDAPAGGEGS